MDEDCMKYDIIVCGDSYSAASTVSNHHYSELLQDRYGYSVLCLARGSMSNLGICFQMREAIQIGCKFLLYHSTGSSRVNLVLNDNFDIELGLKNFVYPFSGDKSSYSEYVGHNEKITTDNGVRYPNNDAAIFSTVYQGLLTNPTVKISKANWISIEGYLLYLFDNNLQTEVDRWMFEYWSIKAKDAGIIDINMKSHVGQDMFNFCPADKIGNIYCYHTDKVTQEKVAQNVHQEICKLTL